MSRQGLALLLLLVFIAITEAQLEERGPVRPKGFHYPFAPFYPSQDWRELSDAYNRQSRGGVNSYFRSSKRGIGSGGLRFVPNYLKMLDRYAEQTPDQ